MKKFYYLFLVSGLAGIFVLGFPDFGKAGERDTAYWNEFVFKHRMNENFSIHLKTEQWFLSDVSRLGMYNFTPGAKYSLNEHVDFELNYRYQRLKLRQEFTTEHRVEFIPYLKGEWRGFVFELRNRLEFRNIDGNNSLRLRERIQITRKLKIKDFDFDSYVSNEFFYDSNPNEFNQNRAKIGVSKEVAPGLNLGVYYMYWTIEGRNPYKANVIGTALSIWF